MARFSIGGQVVSIIGVFALDSKPLFQASIYYLSLPLFKPHLLLHFFQDWGSREWVISFLVALVRSPSKTFTSDQCFTLKVGIMGSILMTKAVCWVTPSKVMVVRSFEVVAAYVLQVWIRCFFTTEMFPRSLFLMSQVTGQISWEQLPSFLL